MAFYFKYTFATCSYKLSRLKTLPAILGSDIAYNFLLTRADIYLGWGYKKRSKQTQDKARYFKKPFYFLEDGFLRSLYPSKYGEPPLSITLDRKAPYFDAFRVTDLEEMIQNTDLTSEQTQEAREAIAFFTTEHLSKYCLSANHMSKPPEDFGKGSLLLIDQTLGDDSLNYGGVTDHVISDMLSDLKENYEGHKIFLKTHPDVVSGKSKSCFSDLLEDVHVLDADISLAALLSKRPKVISLTSLAGFEALLHGCKVITYGLPWYAGYGLTEDRHKDITIFKERRSAQSLEKLFYIAYFKYCRYFNPATLTKGSFWDVATYLAHSARHARRLAGTLYCFGFRPWKRKDIQPFLKTPFNHIKYVSSKRDAIAKGILEDKSAKIFVWSYKQQEDISSLKDQRQDIDIIRVEDSFIRSYGLGTDFIPPLSLAFDSQNLYFHSGPDAPSDIQNYIQQDTPFYLKARAENLLEMVNTHNISKYNLDDTRDDDIKTTKPILLVICQVAGDASLVYGGLPATIKSNADMLKYARTSFPEHFIICRRHPDVVRRHRSDGLTDDILEKYADHVNVKGSILSMIALADDILCLTSLSGFEALLRGKNVHILGKPFYAGHGFCANEDKPSRNIIDLVRASLIDYPIYKDTDNMSLPYGTPERVIHKIIAQKNPLTHPLKYIHLRSHVMKRLYQLKKIIFG
ncbi:MAG: hypothetical protein AAF621_04060 [Pseudomonadota bacterium]